MRSVLGKLIGRVLFCKFMDRAAGDVVNLQKENETSIFHSTDRIFLYQFPLISYSSAELEGLQQDKWHHLCVSWNGNRKTGFGKFYRDGGLIIERSIRQCRTTPRKGDYMTLMGTKESYSKLMGDQGQLHISGFALWNRVLTDEEILENSGSRQSFKN